MCQEEMNTIQFERSELERYLEERSGTTVQIKDVRQLGSDVTGASALKQFGYGRPLLVDYQAGDRKVQVVFHRINRNAFGRERDDDRVAAVWLDFNTFNRLLRHVPTVDMVVHTRGGNLQSISLAEEVLLVAGRGVGSLSERGFRREAMNGKIYVVTEANSDLGKASAFASHK